MRKRNEYAEYKPTSIMGINKIPSHWVESKFRYVTDVLTDYTANGSFKSLADNVEYLSEPDYARLIRLTDLRLNLSNNGIYVNEDSYEFLKKSALFGGEYLIANVGAYAGLVVQMPKYDGVATLGPNMMMARFDEEKVLVKFMVYISHREYIQKQLLLKATASSAQPKLNKEDFRSVEFIYPKIDEQKCIVKYLDNKVGQIDKLIDEKKKLVILLEEKRQAMITEAVTSGINPNVKMKDSGVEWIGEIPEHWEVSKLGRYINIYGSNHEESIEGINFPLFKVNDLNFDSTNLYLANTKEKVVSITKPIKKNIILIPKRGAAIFTNKVRIIECDCFIDSNLMAIKPSNTVNIEYLSYFLLARRLGDIADISTIPQINNKQINPLEFPLFSLEEQKSIGQFIKKESYKLSELKETNINQIQKLKEYRQSLIYEAVTGKIDVRDFETVH